MPTTPRRASDLVAKLRSKATLSDEELGELQTRIDQLEGSAMATHHETHATKHHTSVMLELEAEEEQQ